jgi:D-amino-acid dehydrogenase
MPRVVVIGAGVVGLASAYALEKRGWQVTVLEARTPGYGASRVNAAWVCPALSDPTPSPGLVKQSLRWMRHSDSPLYVQPRPSPEMLRWLTTFWRHCNERCFHSGMAAIAELNRSTFDLYDELTASGVSFEEHRAGILYVLRNEVDIERHLRGFEPLAAYGTATPEPLYGDAVRELEPALSDAIKGGFFFSQERQVRPDSLVRGLVDFLTERGVDIRSGVSVTDFNIAKDRVTDVVMNRGRLETDAVLIAAGVWTPALARLAKRRVPIQPGKGYSLDYVPSPVPLRHALDVYDARHAITPLDGMTRLAGTMEFSGINERIRQERVAAIAQGAAATIKGWPSNPNQARIGTGMRPMSADGLPVIGWLKGYKNLAVASGHGMLGLTLAPSTGNVIADLMTTGKMPEVLQPFDPARF